MFRLAGLLVATASPAAEPVAIAFADLTGLVAGGNLAVRAAELEWKAAETATGSFRRSWLPAAAVEGGPWWYRTGPLGSGIDPAGRAEASVNIFRGGLDSLEDRRRAELAAAARAEHSAVLRDEITSARSLYWEAVAASEQEELLVGFRAGWSGVREGAVRRAAAGQATKTDVLAFDLLARQLDDEIAAARSQVETARTDLAAMLGLPPGTVVTISTGQSATRQSLAEPSGDHSPDTAGTPVVAGAVHPAVEARRRRATALELEARGLIRWWWPAMDVWTAVDVYMTPDRTFAANGDRVEHTAGLRLTLPLFDGGRSSRATTSARLRAAAAETARADHSGLILGARRSSVARRLELLGRLVRSAAESADRADEFYAATLKEYDLGLRNGQDVLSAFERHVGLHRLVIERRRDFGRAAAEWSALRGETP